MWQVKKSASPVSRKQAERIVAFRAAHGYFESVDELDDILSTEKGLDDSIVSSSSKRKTKEDKLQRRARDY